jgi:WD40 repeat protein/flagellar biosynthesis GTPase FlhF
VIPEDYLTFAETETPDNPFPGLRPFEFGESHLYFGRDGQSDQLIRKLSATRFVAVVGASGSGKSSLVRAGLLPDLFSGYMSNAGSHWRVALMRPSNDPLGNLALALNSATVFGSDIEENARIQTAITEATLRRGSLGLVEAVRQNRMASNESLLVVVDQFEELFRFARVSGSEQYRYEAAAFVKLLLDASAQREHAIYVVLTMRSDFLGDCSIFWDLPEAINEGQYLIPRLTRDQRMEAIAGPVAVCGGDIAQRLVNRLLNDMGDNPDQLPILQHALMRTWERWASDHAEGEGLDLRHYEAIGTMSDALSRHADEAYDELPDDESRRVAEKIFKGLTEKEDNREIRRPVELKELFALTGAAQSEVVAVIEIFRREGRSFLMPPAPAPLGESSLIDISHESLIRNWGRLKSWVDEESLSAQIYKRLAETAVLYESGKAGLWGDPDLQIALDWRAQDKPNAAWAARYHPAFDAAMKFLDESMAAREAAARRAEELRRREIKRARMNRIAAVVFFLLFLLALVLFVFARNQTALAQQANREANAARAQAERNAELASRAANNERQAKQTAIEQRRKAEESQADALEKRKEAEASKADALEKKREAEAAKADAVRSAQIARSNEQRAEAAKLEADTQRKTAESEATKNRQLLYAADMNLAQQSYDVGNIVRGRRLLDDFLPGASEGVRPGFELFYLWNLFHKEVGTLESYHKTGVSGVAYSPVGNLLVGVGKDGVVSFTNASTRDTLATLQAHTGNITALAFSPDGQVLATAGKDSTIKLWDANSYRELRVPFPAQEREVTALAFSPDGQVLATGGRDGVLRLWDIASRRLLKELGRHQSTINALTFSPDGKLIATGSADRTARLWEVASGVTHILGNMLQAKGSVLSVAFSPDGQVLAVGGGDHKVSLWSTGSRELLTELEGHTGAVNSVRFSPDGRSLASGGSDKTVIVWTLLKKEGGAPPSLDWVVGSKGAVTLKGHTKDVWSVAFSSDGRSLASGGDDGLIKVWDFEAQASEQLPVEHPTSVRSVATSPDGKTFATGAGRLVKFWDASTHKELASFEDFGEAVWSVAFSPDGRVLAAGGQGKVVKLWDVTSRQRLLPDLVGHTGTVTSIAYSPDRRLLATASRDSTVKLWDASTHEELATLGGYHKPVLCAAFSGDGKLLATGDGDGLVVVWDVEKRTRLGDILQHNGPVNSVAFSPDGSMLASAGDDLKVMVWGTHPFMLLASLEDHADKVRAVAFSPDGRTLATGGDDTDVMLWDTRSFKRLLTLKGHTNSVSSLAFSPDGKTLLTASFDETVRVWRAASDEEAHAAR